MSRYALGLSSFTMASPFSERERDAYRRVAEMGLDAIEVCVEDPALLTAGGIRSAAEASGLAVAICAVFGPDRDPSLWARPRRPASWRPSCSRRTNLQWSS